MQKIRKNAIKFLYRLLGNLEFKMLFGLSKGLKRRFGRGFKPRIFLTKEEKFLANLDFSEKIVFDIGSYIGMYCLFFAREVGSNGKVFAFEPNPENYKELLFNVKLNKFSNIIMYNLAVGKSKSKMDLLVPLYPSRGSLNSETKKEFLKEENKNFEVEVESIDSLISKKLILKPDFVKIDVEGFEREVIEGMKNTISKHKPKLFIEVHGKIQENMVYFLLKEKYFIYHIESDKNIKSADALTIKDGHIYCKFSHK